MIWTMCHYRSSGRKLQFSESQWIRRFVYKAVLCIIYVYTNIFDYFYSVGGYLVNFVTLFVDFCWKLLKTRFQWMVIIVIGFGVDLSDVSGVKQGMLQFLAHRKRYGFLFLDMLEIIRLLSCFMVKKAFRVLFSDRISLMNHFHGIDVAHYLRTAGYHEQ